MSVRVILGRDPVPFYRVKDGRQRFRWFCSVCGRDGNWGDGFQGYGSALLEENETFLFVVCSEGCRTSRRARELKLKADGIRLGHNPRSGALQPGAEKRLAAARKWYEQTQEAA